MTEGHEQVHGVIVTELLVGPSGLHGARRVGELPQMLAHP